MAKRRCAACGCLFEPRRNVPHQRYCSERGCQRTRRRRWQRQKLKADADYRANQAAAQRRWRERHPAYWRDYRQRHPDSTARNREQPLRVPRRRRLQTWTRTPPKGPFVQALTDWFRWQPQGLQRWTRTWWKCTFFPMVSVVLMVIAKRGLDGQRAVGKVAYGPWKTSNALTCTP
jgi:hypothetical protein